jgi:AcrR family transcriptional regulator
MRKGEKTKQGIVEIGLEMASRLGLESLSIGDLAKAAGMSKSGLFGHFQSKERLQMEILDHAARAFADKVVVPALRTQAGIPRIKELVRRWISWEANLPGGCIFVSTSNEFSDRPGKVRVMLYRQQQEWLACLGRVAQSAVKAGDFREDIDCEQFAFELYSLILGFHLYHKLLNSPDIGARQEEALERLLESYKK